MREPIGVLYFITSWVVGGTETQLLYLLRHLDRSRYQPHVCSLYTDPKVVQVMGEIDVPAFSLGVRRVRYPDTLLRLLRLAHYCRQQQIKIIQAVRTDELTVVVGKLAGVPVILGAERDVPARRQEKNILAKHLDQQLTGIIANSQAAARRRQSASRLRSDRLYVIPNGLDLSRFEPTAASPTEQFVRPAGVPVLMIVARLDVGKKGHLVLLEALQQPGMQDTHLLVVGDGVDRGLLCQKIGEMGLEDHVHLLGYRDDIGQVLKLADIVIVPSIYESSPNVILESWAARRSVVATTVGGIPELVTHGVNGLLVPPADGHALAQAIVSLVQDPAQRNTLALNGHKLVRDRFSAQQMANDTMALYDGLLARVAEKSARKAYQSVCV